MKTGNRDVTTCTQVHYISEAYGSSSRNYCYKLHAVSKPWGSGVGNIMLPCCEDSW